MQNISSAMARYELRELVVGEKKPGKIIFPAMLAQGLFTGKGKRDRKE